MRLEAILRRKQRLARAALLWERLWPALWPAVATVGLFLALTLGGLWLALPGWPHVALLFVFLGLLVVALWTGLRALSLPDEEAARRRLERNSTLDHRPLTVLNDRLATGAQDAQSAALWRLHRERAAAALRRLRVGIPRAGLAERDPWAMRVAVALVVLVAFIGAGSDAERRLASAFRTDFSTPAAALAVLEAWLTPPVYTRLPPIFLTTPEASASVLRVPEGSTLLARVSGGSGRPVLTLDDEAVPFTDVDASAYQIEHAIGGGRELAVVQERSELGRWLLDVVTDEVPRVALVKEPAPSARGALGIEYEASDDYGLASVKATFRRAGASDTIELDLPLAGLRLKSARERSFHDLTPHTWAGLPVTLRLSATDAREQLGESEDVDLVLPERNFRHPVARAIIEQRKILTLDPTRRDKVAAALRALTLLPGDYFDDAVVHLALRIASRRLVDDSGDDVVSGVQSLLWDTALRIEDGNVSIAGGELRAAQKALMDALARDASDEEIQRLMDELQRAMAQYLEALADQAMRMAERGAPPLDPNGTLMRGDELQRMLERARTLSQMGAREAARQLLAELQNILENLRAGVMARPGEEGGGQALRGLNDLMHQQQELLDRTFRSHRQGVPPDGMSFGDMAARQGQLRRMLGEVMRAIGEGGFEIPGALGRADQAMREALDALGQAAPGEAVGPQTSALDQLRQGAGELMRSLMANGGLLDSELDYEGAGELGRDPFGRVTGGRGAMDDRRVRIPDESDVQRAREILQELYRRAGQRTRSATELDYIGRLLRRF